MGLCTVGQWYKRCYDCRDEQLPINKFVRCSERRLNCRDVAILICVGEYEIPFFSSLAFSSFSSTWPLDEVDIDGATTRKPHTRQR